MRFYPTVLLSLLATATYSDAFVHKNVESTRIGGHCFVTTGNSHRLDSLTMMATDPSATKDCGCGPEISYAGKPSEKARGQNPRKVLADSSVMTLTGERTTMDDVLDGSSTSLILQYNQRRAELLAAGVNLAIVSIGKPEVGLDLVKHLGVEDGADFVFVDPDNEVYDALDLNRGVDTTFFSPATPMAFANRLFKGKGLLSSELKQVLSKWKDAFIIPSKREQAFFQGGAFLFSQDDTIFAHYDEAAAAHAEPDEMVDRALETAASKQA
eukprot:scaffold22595_cov102-Cylindrotheca_fusiformis.AAC.2